MVEGGSLNGCVLVGRFRECAFGWRGIRRGLDVLVEGDRSPHPGVDATGNRKGTESSTSNFLNMVTDVRPVRRCTNLVSWAQRHSLDM